MAADDTGSEPCESRLLQGKKLVGFALGTMGQMAPIGFYNTYMTTFYNYTVGLNPVLTFIAMFLGLTVFSVSSPIFGTLVDNRTPGRFGKRKPVLLACIPLFLVLMILAWLPPMCPVGQPNHLPTVVYCWSITIAIYLNQGLVVSTYLSMLSEQSTDKQNRVRVATLQGIFSIVGTVMSILVPILIQGALPDPQEVYWTQESGKILVSTLPFVGIFFGVLGASVFIIVFLSSDESFFEDTTCQVRKKRQSIMDTFKQIMVPFKDRNFRKWLGNAFFFNMAIRVLIVVLIPAMTFVLLLEESDFPIFFLAILPFALGGYVLWITRIKSAGLKKAYGLSLIVNVIFAFIIIIFIFDMSFILRFVLGAAIIGILISALVGGYLFPNPIVSRLVDEAPEDIKQEARTKNRPISGSYFGLYIFAYNISQAFANIMLAFILTEETKEDPLFIILCIPIAGIMVLISYLFLRKLHLPKESTEVVVQVNGKTTGQDG